MVSSRWISLLPKLVWLLEAQSLQLPGQVQDTVCYADNLGSWGWCPWTGHITIPLRGLPSPWGSSMRGPAALGIPVLCLLFSLLWILQKRGATNFQRLIPFSQENKNKNTFQEKSGKGLKHWLEMWGGAL